MFTEALKPLKPTISPPKCNNTVLKPIKLLGIFAEKQITPLRKKKKCQPISVNDRDKFVFLSSILIGYSILNITKNTRTSIGITYFVLQVIVLFTRYARGMARW